MEIEEILQLMTENMKKIAKLLYLIIEGQKDLTKTVEIHNDILRYLLKRWQNEKKEQDKDN